MIQKLIQITLILSLCSFLLKGEERMTPEQYIEKFKESAIREMNRSGVPASITLSQGMLESGNGNSELAKKANNHFGIKCHTDWTGPSIKIDDDKKNECFRKYKSVYDSYVDHSDFLMNRSRYASLFDLKITDYKGWAKGLKSAGYATNPKYADLLIDLIERHALYKYDKGYKPSKQEDKEEVVPNEIVVNEGNIHKISVSQNRIRYITIRQGDTFYSLEKEFEIKARTMRKWNDMSKKDVLKAGQIIYLQPKRNKSKADYHFVANESLWDISQKYGVKMKKLLKYNGLSDGQEPEPGARIKLRR